MKLKFDRGTLLLLNPPADLAPGELPGVLWDARVRAHRAPAWRGPAIRAALAARGIPCDASGAAPAVLPAEAWSPPPLRPYQEAALVAWELAGRRGLVALPTGSGKTLVGLAAAARSGRASLFLTPTRVLLDHWRRALARVYGGPVGCLGDGERSVAPVTVATFESAYRQMHRLGDRFELVVVDEVHHFGRSVRDEALEMLTAPLRLGLSATPPHEAGVVARLADLVGPPVYRLTLADLAGSWLAPYDLVTLTVDLNPAERRAYEAARASFVGAHRAFRRAHPEASWADFARAAQGSEEGRRALAGWRRSRRLVAFPQAKAEALRALLARCRNARTLVFTADNEAAYAVAREHLIMPITCDIGRAERADALARFARGELRALVSAQVLNEGVDVPEADVGVVVGAAQGEREHVQRVGRLLRPREGKRARVYELVVRDSLEVERAARRRRSLVAPAAP